MKLLLLLVPLVAFSQNPVLDGMMRGAELGRMMQEAKLREEQRRLLDQQLQQLKAMEEQQAAVVRPAPTENSAQSVKSAIETVKSLYSDFSEFFPEMSRLSAIFSPGEVEAAMWVEMLYLVAKHASFSQSPSAARGAPPRTPTPRKTQVRLRSPEGFSSSCSPTVEATIAGNFNGWDGESVFKLDNGQIWQQAEYSYMYSYAYRPEVTIYHTSAGCKMKVEDEEETVLVERIK